MMSNNNIKARKITMLLLENGANPNFLSKEKWAPIHIAVRKKNVETVNFILAYNSECKEIWGKDENFNINLKGG